MRFHLTATPKSAHQVSHQQAMAEAMRKMGIEFSLGADLSHSPHEYVVCWGWHAGAKYREKGHQVLVLERGYLGDRTQWTSLAWNGLNGRGSFPVNPGSKERFDLTGARLLPWHLSGEYVLITGQVPGDASLQGQDLGPWYPLVAAEAEANYQLPVYFRAHPIALQRGLRRHPAGTFISKGPLSQALARAAVVINYNSNAGVDAVLAGTSLLAFDPGSMAYEMSGTQFGQQYQPEREAWAFALAAKQWTIEEIRQGTALAALLEIAPCPSKPAS